MEVQRRFHIKEREDSIKEMQEKLIAEDLKTSTKFESQMISIPLLKHKSSFMQRIMRKYQLLDLVYDVKKFDGKFYFVICCTLFL